MEKKYLVIENGNILTPIIPSWIETGIKLQKEKEFRNKNPIIPIWNFFKKAYKRAL